MQTGKKMPGEIKEILLRNGFVKSFRIFNVVGTNGKGSISKFLADGFASTGLKVGLFTSPHLIRANERIKINNKEITDKEFEDIFNKIKYEKMNFFAYTYVVAMLYFQKHNCDVVVLEAGIGGNLDSTKAIEGDWGCITNVSLDHTDILGKTISEITADKVGIYNQDMVFYFPSSLGKELQEIIINKIPSAKLIDNEGDSYKERNKAFAKAILKDNDIDFDDFNFPDGRTQIFKHNGFDVIVDVAHNYDGIEKSLEEISKNGVVFDQVVLTMKRTKDSDGVVKLLNTKEVYVFQKDEHFYSASELGGINLIDPRTFFRNINKNTLFIGSFHLAGEVLDEKNKY